MLFLDDHPIAPAVFCRAVPLGNVVLSFSWVCFKMCERNVIGYPSYQSSGEKRHYLYAVFPSAGCSKEKVPRCDRNCPDTLRARPSAQRVPSLTSRQRRASRRAQRVAGVVEDRHRELVSEGGFGACFASTGLGCGSTPLGSCSLVCSGLVCCGAQTSLRLAGSVRIQTLKWTGLLFRSLPGVLPRAWAAFRQRERR